MADDPTPKKRDAARRKTTPPRHSKRRFLIAVEENDLGCVREELELLANASPRTRKGAPALLRHAFGVAASRGHVELGAYLMDRGVDAGLEHWDALVLAVRKGHSAFAAMLLDRGLPVSMNGEQLLREAVGNGHRDVAILLLERGATNEIEIEPTLAPLAVAARRGRWDMVEMLLDRGAKRGREEALRQAAGAPAALGILRRLLEGGWGEIGPDARDAALAMAVERGLAAHARALDARGARLPEPAPGDARAAELPNALKRLLNRP